MKRFYYLATALLVLAGAAGCKKNADVQEPEKQSSGRMIPFTVTAGQGAQKTSMVEGVLSWNSGDQLTVCEGDGSNSTVLSLTGGENTASGTFSGEISDEVTDGTLLFGLYNATLNGGSSSYISYSTSVPAEQTYNATSFQPGIYPSVGSGTYKTDGSTSLSLENPMGILRIKLIGTAEVTKVKITAASSNIAGNFSVMKIGSTQNISGSGDNSKSVTITCSSPVQLTNEGVYFNFVVAPFTEQVVTVDVNDGAGSENIQVAVSSSSATKADITPCIKKAGTYGEAEITGGTKVKWVQLWAGGPKFAEYNVGATSVGDYGGYYCWGSDIDQDPYSWCYASYSLEDIQYGDYDTAKNLWGSNWQMPTRADFQDLHDKTIMRSVTWFGKSGALFQGVEEGYTCNMVFFPDAGYFDGSSFYGAGGNGYYWSSTPEYTEYAIRLFSYGESCDIDMDDSYKGMSVRAILHE